MAEVRIVVKAGAGYADPWITVIGHDRDEVKPGVNGGDPYVERTVTAAEDASKSLQELRELGAFSAVKLISQEFAGAPAAGVESVLASFPNAQVINEDAGPLYPASQAPPEQSFPACSQCGAPTKPRSGTGGNGVAYSGFACTKVRTHFDLTK